MFEFLFKFSINDYRNGELLLTQPTSYLVLLVVVVGVVIIWGSVRAKTPPGWQSRLLLPTFRISAVVLIALLLTDPQLELTAEKRQQNLVAVLVDDSVSMQINDSDEGSRAQQVQQWLGSGSASMLAELDNAFATRLYAFGSDLRPVAGADDLNFQDGSTNYSAALQALQVELLDQPLAGIVLLSDGVGNDDPDLEATLRRLRERELPVFPVRVGSADWQRDIEVSRFEVPDHPLLASRYTATVDISQQGFSEQTVELTVENDSQILFRQPVVLSAAMNRFEIPLLANEAGNQRLRAQVTPMAGEMLAANNALDSMIYVESTPRRVLYFEGEPRFEFKFIRRVLDQDNAIHLNGLVRTADARYLRIGIESRDLLQEGFPQTAEELFDYDALILGNLPASLLTREQQQLIVDFVERRGGGLLFLGGQQAFAEGGYQDSVLERLFPVMLPERARPDFMLEAKIQPTDQLDAFPALHLAGEAESQRANWLRLPPLTLVNPLTEVKPGARLLLTAEGNNAGQPLVALAAQNYGKGRVMAFPVQNSWLWQMHHEIDLQDQTHERLWQQLVRWLAVDSPPRLTLQAESVVATGSAINVFATAYDADFQPENQAAPEVWLSSPGMADRRLEFTRHPDIPGRWQAQAEAGSSGEYWLRSEPADSAVASETRFVATAQGSEFHQARRNDPMLNQLASATGGTVIDPSDWDVLTAALATQQRGNPVVQRHQLWDMPFLFLLLFALLFADWALRRRLGLV